MNYSKVQALPTRYVIYEMNNGTNVIRPEELGTHLLPLRIPKM